MNFDIEKRRKELNLTLEQIGNYVGVSKSTVKKWESGYIDNMKRDKIALLAEILQISPLAIIGIDTYDVNTESFYNKYNVQSIKTKKIPMFGKIACGEPITANQEYDTFIEASTDLNVDFCLTAKGDSMINARIFDGDIVFLVWQSDVLNGEIAAVRIGDDVTLKRVYKYNNRIELRAENPLYKPLNYEGQQLEEIEIIGKAVFFQSAIK